MIIIVEKDVTVPGIEPGTCRLPVRDTNHLTTPTAALPN